jgi:hypothetical protein
MTERDVTRGYSANYAKRYHASRHEVITLITHLRDYYLIENKVRDICDLIELATLFSCCEHTKKTLFRFEVEVSIDRFCVLAAAINLLILSFNDARSREDSFFDGLYYTNNRAV